MEISLVFNILGVVDAIFDTFVEGQNSVISKVKGKRSHDRSIEML
jgi:hypothetical protein